MKFLLDEMYAGLKEYFEILGWDVLTIHDVGLQGAKDKEIVEYAKNNNLLLTQKNLRQSRPKGVKLMSPQPWHAWGKWVLIFLFLACTHGCCYVKTDWKDYWANKDVPPRQSF